MVVVRPELAAHSRVCDHRTFVCKWIGCSVQLKAMDRDQHHLDCPKRVVRCPNDYDGCHQSIAFDSMAQHRALCPYESCDCLFADVGYTARMLRREIEKHKHDQCVKHNDLMLTAFKEQRQAMESMKDHVMPNVEKIVLRVKHDVLIGKEPIVTRFPTNPTTICSEDLVTRGFTMTFSVETKESRPEYQDFYGLYLTIRQGLFPCNLNCTFEVVHHDGLPISEKKLVNKLVFTENKGWGLPKFISKAEVASPASPYVKDGYVTFKVTFSFI